jgi:eukaryotic-like serine/threonine-protein kinase
MKALTPGLELGSRFALIRRVAEGGSSEVWLAEDRELGRRVALKVIDGRMLATPAVRARMENEIGLARKLPAGRAVEILGLHDVDGLLLLEMEYLSGGDLGQFRGRSLAVFARPLLEAAEALGAAHDAGLVHGDLKCANVLLDAGGHARLADFGLMTMTGEAVAGGSPYNMSPQRLRGEPASPADDLYAFGAMLYELLSGQPPYYPGITRDRVLHEPVPPLVPRAPAPERARQLALRLLAKSPDARPASMQEVGRELEAALAEPDDEAIAPRAAAPGIAAPQDTPQRRQGGPRWQRAAVAAAVLGVLGLVYVFAWLPGQVEEHATATGDKALAVATAEARRLQQAQQDDEAVAAARLAAEQARAAYEQRRSAIESQAAAIWAPEALATARAQGDGAAGRYALQQYDAARGDWEQGLAALDAIEAGRAAALAQALAAGEAALTQGQSESAARSFQLALSIDPGNAAAGNGLARARTLDEVFALLDQAVRDEKSGRFAAAGDGYRKALAVDPAAPGAREALQRMEARQAGDAYAAAMSRALADGRAEDARSALEQARSLRPGSREVAEALAQLDRDRRAAGLQELVARAAAAERAERWEDARLAWSEALGIEPTLEPAREGLDRVVPRVQLDAQLDGLIAAPQRLWTEAGRTTARSAIASAADAAPPKGVLSGKAQRLAAMLEAAQIPVSLRLESDGVTEVVIYRVGRMGSFERRDVELLPGRYAVVGTRPGYRDVRKEVEIPPGSEPQPVAIRCEEPI